MNFLLDGNNMKYVRILTISGILVACLLGCAVRRSDGVHDSEKSQERNELVWLTARTDAKITATTTVVDRWRNLRIHWKDYDLSKPPDQNGNYPVKHEGWAEGSEQESQNEKSDISENTKEDSNGKVKTEREKSYEKTENTDLDIKAGTQPLWWWLIGVLMAVAGLIYLWWKYGKKDKTK